MVNRNTGGSNNSGNNTGGNNTGENTNFTTQNTNTTNTSGAVNAQNSAGTNQIQDNGLMSTSGASDNAAENIVQGASGTGGGNTSGGANNFGTQGGNVNTNANVNTNNNANVGVNANVDTTGASVQMQPNAQQTQQPQGQGQAQGQQQGYVGGQNQLQNQSQAFEQQQQQAQSRLSQGGQSEGFQVNLAQGFVPNENFQDLESLGIKKKGGGWYELPNGENVQGKEEALKEYQNLVSQQQQQGQGEVSLPPYTVDGVYTEQQVNQGQTQTQQVQAQQQGQVRGIIAHGPSSEKNGAEILRFKHHSGRGHLDIQSGQLLRVGEDITEDEADQLLSYSAWSFERVDE